MSRVAAILRWLGRFGRSFRSDAASSDRPVPHPANVPGPFYVEDGCCITCGVWEDIAPDLLAWTPDDDRPHCFVARQPQTDAEFGRMLGAMEAADLECIRVRGCRPDWAGRLREAGLGGQIDPPGEPRR